MKYRYIVCYIRPVRQVTAWQIDFEGKMRKIPMYEKIVSVIVARIKNGEMQPGDKIGSEQMLSKHFGVGRSTLREGLRLLQEAGYIEIKNGIGSFIKQPPYLVDNKLSALQSTGTMIAEAGYTASADNLWIKHLNSDEYLRSSLQLKDDEKVVIVKRERKAGNSKIALAFNVFPENLVGNTMDKGIATSIFHELEQKCDIFVQYAITRFKGLDPEQEWDNEAAKILKGPIILMEQLHFDCKNRPVLFSFDYVLTSFMNLTLQRKRIF